MNPLAEITRLTSTSSRVRYSPTMEQQLAMSPQGVAGQFIVQYDVERSLDAGEVQVKIVNILDKMLMLTFQSD